MDEDISLNLASGEHIPTSSRTSLKPRFLGGRCASRLAVLRHGMALVLALSGSATGQVLGGDVLVCLAHYPTNSRLEHFRADGTPVLSIPGAAHFRGVLLTQSGQYATGSRFPNKIHLFDIHGAPTSTFEINEVGYYPSDLDAFRDGTLVTSDAGGRIELYSESGSHQGAIDDPLLGAPAGLYVDDQDFLWACDSIPRQVFAWNRQGELQYTFPVAFRPWDLVRDEDGTLWIADGQLGIVHHLDVQGADLGSLSVTVAGGGVSGLGLSSDGTLYLAGPDDVAVFRYTKQGVLLGSFPIPNIGTVYRLDIVRDGFSSTPYCLGDGGGTSCPCSNPGASGEGCANSTGAGGRLLGIGAPSLSAGQWRVLATQLVPGKAALLFSGTNVAAGGAGVMFGDGLRCTGGSLLRHGVQQTDSSGGASWAPGVIAAAGWTAGDTRRLQVWYRDTENSPCGSRFNLTHGIEITVSP